MIKNNSIIKSIVTLTIIASTLSTTVFAAWGWETPGYQWARENRLTSITETSKLHNKVSLDNFYSTLIKYLRLKGVRAKKDVRQNLEAYTTFNKALQGIAAVVDGYIWRESLTPQEYREVVNYLNHLATETKNIYVGTIPNNAKYLTRDDLEDLYLYFSLARYKAATLITEPTYRMLVLNNLSPTKEYNVGYVKNKEIIDYNIRPYHGDISRREFLLLMFSLLSNQNVGDEEIINQFVDGGVLEGYSEYELQLELEKSLTYAEMFTFLRRFEIFDFNPEPEVEDGEETDSDDKVKEYN